MKKYTAYTIGLILSSLALCLPAEASAINADSNSEAVSAALCGQPPECEQPADTANRGCELAMDTEDAILTGIVGAAVIGAAIIASNEHHHRETIIVEQAPPPPPPVRTVIVHENDRHRPGYVPRHETRHHVSHHAPAPPKHHAHGSRHHAGHTPDRAKLHAPAPSGRQAHGSRHDHRHQEQKHRARR